jgi:putative FmdB family regulatory protein
MPIYEYECQKCSHVTEALRPMKDADEAIACESCGSTKTRRAHSVVSVGSGSSSDAGACPLPMGGCGRCGDPRGSCGMS